MKVCIMIEMFNPDKPFLLSTGKNIDKD